MSRCGEDFSVFERWRCRCSINVGIVLRTSIFQYVRKTVCFWGGKNQYMCLNLECDIIELS
jgi:hypothetical protein